MKSDIKDEKDTPRFFAAINPFKKEKSTTPSESLKEALDTYIEDLEESNTNNTHETQEEKLLLSNVLTLKDLNVTDIMIPRADIVAIELSSTNETLLELLAENQFSRIPVYKETLDEILGTIHIKDVLARLAKNEPYTIHSLMRETPIVSPAMPILDLVHLMKKERRHMAMVVDEYGGIDGLVTIGDIIEEVLGEIDDEYDREDEPAIIKKSEGAYLVDARIDLDDLEEKIGQHFQTEDEEDDVDTLAGFICSIAGRLPARGEIIDAPELGASFEILESDPRKIKRVHLTLDMSKKSDDAEE